MTVPQHIEAVNNEIRRTFDYITRNTFFIQQLFDCKVEDLDQALLWTTFDELAYKTIFKAVTGDIEPISNPFFLNKIYSAVYKDWPEIYYLEMLAQANVADRYDIDDEVFFILKEQYIPFVDELLIPE